MENSLRSNNKQLGGYKFLVIIILYCLFALNRIKFFAGGKIDGIELNNAIWLFPVLIIIKSVFMLVNTKINRGKKYLKPYDKYLPYLYMLLLIFIILGGFKVENYDQYIYSVLQIVVPILFLFFVDINEDREVDNLIRKLVILGLVYSMLAMISSLNYNDIMGLLGNDSNLQYEGQKRASLMIGSSITVSYYFNITLPLNFYLFFNDKDKKWRIIGLISILFNVSATLILLSRVASLCCIITVGYFIFYVEKKGKLIYKSLFIVMLSFLFVYVANEFDIQRLFMGFKDVSTFERMESLALGWHIFEKNMILGSGVGKYFLRAYTNREIQVDGVIGLVDPHNTYIYAMSELGIIGSIILLGIFIRLIMSYRYIQNLTLKKTAYITIIIYFIGAMGGSHIFNEIIFSTVLYIYLGLYMSVGKRDYYKSKSQ